MTVINLTLIKQLNKELIVFKSETNNTTELATRIAQRPQTYADTLYFWIWIIIRIQAVTWTTSKI